MSILLNYILSTASPIIRRKSEQISYGAPYFPDIRYVSSLPRTATHTKNVTLQRVIDTENPFFAGVLFHTYVDEKRERIAQEQRIYDHLNDIPPRYKAHLLKVVEDELCYEKN